ncbi:MAG: DUF433 domain-containing protein [Dehalococcoidia bacterium]
MSDRISIDPATCSGKPCIRGTRAMVHQIFGLLGAGYSIDATLDAYPALHRDDIVAVLDWASELALSQRRDSVAAG